MPGRQGQERPKPRRGKPPAPATANKTRCNVHTAPSAADSSRRSTACCLCGETFMAGRVEAAAARPSQHSGSNKNVACASCRLFHLDQAYEVEAVLSDVVAVSSAEQKIVLRHDAELLRRSERRLHGRNVDGTNSNRGEPAEGLREDQDQDHRPALLLGWSAAVAELRGQKQNQSSVEHVAAQAGEVHLRCVRLDKQDLLAPGGLDPYWPYMGSLNYDNAPVAEIKPPQPGHPRKEEPFLNITQRVRKILLSRAEEAGDHEHHGTSATSEIAFSFSASFFAARGRMDEDWPDPPTEFALQAFFVRKLSPDHLKAKAFSIMRSKIHNENRVWKHFARFDVGGRRQQHKNSTGDGVEAEGENELDQSDDDELQLVREDVEERTVSLNCPIGGILPIKIPVYSEHCEHLQSVDLENFLDLLPQTRNPAKKWRCAICHRAMRLWDLRFCSFTYEIIEGVRMKNQGRGAGAGRVGGDEDPEEEDPLLSDSFVLEEDEARVLVNADGSYSFDFEKELQKEREEKFGRAMDLDEDGDSAAKRLKKDEAEQEVQKIARVNEIASSVNVHNDNKCDCDAPVDEVGRRGALHGALSDRVDDGELHSDSCQLIELEDSSDEG